MLNLNDLGSLHIQKSYHLTYAVSLFESPKRNASHSHVCASNVGVFVINPCLLCHDCYCLLCHDSFTCVPWLIHMCAMTHSHVCHDSFTCVPWLIHMCAMTHSHVCHASFTCVPCLIHMCAMTYSHVCHDSFTYVPWLIHVCAMPHSHVCHDSLLPQSDNPLLPSSYSDEVRLEPHRGTSWWEAQDMTHEWDRHSYIWCDMSHDGRPRTRDSPTRVLGLPSWWGVG